MRTKLTLDLEQLAVDSFDTTSLAKPEGTVFGEQCTCPGAPTCAATCDDPSCEATCDASCSCRVTKCDSCPYTCGTNSYCADCLP